MLQPLPQMRPFVRLELVLLALLVAFVYAQNPNAPPWPIKFEETASIGPDGPWWYIPQAVDFPDQIVSLFPSLSRSSMIVSSDVCSSQSSRCPLPIQAGWSPSGAYRVDNGPNTQSAPFDPADWDQRLTTLLGLQDFAFFIEDRFTLYFDGKSSNVAFLDSHAMLVSDNLSVTFPGGAEYTVDVGLFSLDASQPTISWDPVNATSAGGNVTLASAYRRGYIPSLSYGLHVGSVVPNVTGSLVLGGYDSSRCITEPIASDSTSFQLVDIALNVSRGASAFLNVSSTPQIGLLRANGSQVNVLDVYPEPGVPYMYLPSDTCDAIASHLPVTFNAEFGLYFWNTDSPAYSQIVSSPHSLVFSFSSSDSSQVSTINIPFAVLNLTLESPLTSSSTPYFPCSPWTPNNAPYTLGRSFLQAAFLGQNFHTNKFFLSQAPGPNFLPENVKTIERTDESLSAAPNAPDWDSTWASTLQALSGSSNGTTNPNPTLTPAPSGSSGLSGGAIAGIVIASVVGILAVAGAVWFFLRRRHRQPINSASSSGEWARKEPLMADPSNDHSPAQFAMSGVKDKPYQYTPMPQEMPTKPPRAELDSNSHPRAGGNVAELGG